MTATGPGPATHPRDLSLSQARELVARAVDKAEQLGLRGGLAVVGASGALVSASRLDNGGPGGMARARSKAWISATQQVPSSEHLHRMTVLAPAISSGFTAASPEAMFPGAGGMPVLREGIVVAGIAASGATVSPFLPTGAAPEVLSAEGEPANPEDLLVAYALDVPYVGQHGDDRARWQARFGDLMVSPEASLGMKPAPSATAQDELAWAISLCDAVLAAAAASGLRVSVAVVDRGGDPVQQDRMDDAVAAGVDVALATASAAARFGADSGELATIYGGAVEQLGALSPSPFLAVPGGCPLVVGGRVVGGLGVGGSRPRGVCGDRGTGGLVTGGEHPVRVAVLGCGAIGSLYAAHLARVPGVEVWAVDPWAEHVEAIEAHGLRVTGHADFVAPVRARTDASRLPACDFGLVATKALHTKAAVTSAEHALGDATVVSVQNGLGNEEVIAEVLSRVVRGSIVTAGHVTEPGTVRYDAPGDSWFGPFEPSPAGASEIARFAGLLTAGGLRTFAVDDARGPQWTKVVFNASTSAVAALTGLSIGQVCTHPTLRAQVDLMVQEALTVCRAAGIELLRTPESSITEAIEEAFGHLPSMLQDVRARRATEVDVLNGGIAAEGRRRQVPTPLHDAMVALVHGLESSW